MKPETESAPGAVTDEVRDVLEVHNPISGDIVGTLPIHGPTEVSLMARELRRAQPEWAALGPDGRARWLMLWRDWFLDNSDRLLGIVQQETGKSWGDTSLEILAAVDPINYWTSHAAGFLAPDHPKPFGVVNALKRLEVQYVPQPLVGVIVPWNYPLAMPMMDIPAALMAGCAVLSKPSEFTPLVWAEAVRGFREDVGAPPVLACATGLGATGAAVVDEVDMIQFTGSTKTGRRIAIRAAERLIPASLELGGKDPMLVLADADVERAANGAVYGAFFNAGQSCVSVERVYVEAPVYEDFVGRVVKKTNALRVGQDAPQSYDTDLGSLANEAQLAIVERQVQDARAKGARIVAGGNRTGSGCLHEPTVIVDVDHSMACMTEETFGPTVAIMKVADVEEAVRLANDTIYGLAASVWSKDPEKAKAVAEQLQTGAVNINSAMMHVLQLPAPMGGWRSSGIGTRNGGANGIRKYCKSRTVVQDRFYGKTEPFWYPYVPRSARLQARMGRFAMSKDWRRRLGRPQP